MVSPHYKPVAQEVGPPLLNRCDQGINLIVISGKSKIAAMKSLAEIGNGPSRLHQDNPYAKAGCITFYDELLREIWQG